MKKRFMKSFLAVVTSVSMLMTGITIPEMKSYWRRILNFHPRKMERSMAGLQFLEWTIQKMNAV